MPKLRALVRAAGGRRLAAAGIALALVITCLELHSTNNHLREESEWLRSRLADRREMVGRQRQEMAQVAAAVDRVARAEATIRDRASQVRRLAQLEQSTPVAAVPQGITPVSATEPVPSEDATRALAQLAWVEEQTTTAADSMNVLSALLSDHRTTQFASTPSIWPVKGIVTSPFGYRESPMGPGSELHPGIDIQARYGMPVAAGGDGQVIFAGRDPGYGTLVIVDHGRDVETLYGHLSALYVHEGQHVRRGDIVGALGASGRVTGVHLHYEVRVAGRPVDPHRFLN